MHADKYRFEPDREKNERSRIGFFLNFTKYKLIGWIMISMNDIFRKWSCLMVEFMEKLSKQWLLDKLRRRQFRKTFVCVVKQPKCRVDDARLFYRRQSYKSIAIKIEIATKSPIKIICKIQQKLWFCQSSNTFKQTKSMKNSLSRLLQINAWIIK